MINYRHLADSIDFYLKKEYQRIETPWWVPREIANVTKPPGVEDYHLPLNDKVLVASGEQSFLNLANKGQLPAGKFQTTTPCFRNETQDLLHRKHFIKNELINTKDITVSSLDEMIENAREFFSNYIEKDKLEVIKEDSHLSSINYDIVARVKGEKIELGSYGIRQCEFLKWVYGTGCAEPRLSLVLNRLELEKGDCHE